MLHRQLQAKIEGVSAIVTVIGQGYVGLPLAIQLATAGYPTFGLDNDWAKVQSLKNGRSPITDVTNEMLCTALASGKYSPSADPEVLSRSDVVIICVPTPLRKSKDPDLSYIAAAVATIKARLHSGQLIVLESTTYPGTTEEVVVSELEQTGFQVGRDFFVCFSPERIDPGNKTYRLQNTPKVVGGVTRLCGELCAQLYRHITHEVIQVSSARTAEMVKLLENTFRAVNIGLVNELALMAERMGIDIWEVIEAAATKPFGFMPFYPGPGIGGHCIPIDPVYLSWKAKTYGFYNKFIELASDINANMPRHVVAKVAEALNLEGKALNGAKILVLGVAYKRDVNDVRESPGVEVMYLLESQGAQVDFCDPLVESIRMPDGRLRLRVSLTQENLEEYDCVVLATDHSAFDYQWLARHSHVIVDTRNAFRAINAPNIVRLGAPTPRPDEWRVQITRAAIR